MSEALRQVVWKCDSCGGDAQAIFGIFPSCKCGSTSFKAAQPPAPTAQPAATKVLIERLHARTESPPCNADGTYTVGNCSPDVLMFEAAAEIERLRADAARYRWLLANYARGDGYTAIDAALNDGEADTQLSPAIDAAMRDAL